MAAELSYKSVMGKKVAEIFTVRTPAWHQLGLLLEDSPSYADAVRHLDYDVEKQPYHIPLPDGTYAPSKDAYYTIRKDTGKFLGTVGSSYEVVPNREAFKILEPLVDQGVLKLETGGVLRDGADAWLMGRWDLDRFGPEAREVLGGEVLPYTLVAANHSGRRGILVGITPTRVVCANTLSMAEHESNEHRHRWVMVDHRTGAKARLAEAAERLFRGIVDRYEVVAKQYRLLKGCVLSEDDFRRMVLDVVAPDPIDDPRFVPDAPLAASVRARAERKRVELRRLWFEGTGHDGTPSAWNAYQGVAEALDHNVVLWPTRKGSWRTGALLDGQLAQLKNAVLDAIVEHAHRELAA